MKEFADIIINRKSPAVDRVFTYRIPSHLQAEAEVGMLARVPFNREKLEGVSDRWSLKTVWGVGYKFEVTQE